MVFVEVRLSTFDLAAYMADMRLWLDRSLLEAAEFSYGEQFDGARARLAFQKRAEAEAFAARFAGEVILDTVPAPPRGCAVAR